MLAAHLMLFETFLRGENGVCNAFPVVDSEDFELVRGIRDGLQRNCGTCIRLFNFPHCSQHVRVAVEGLSVVRAESVRQVGI